ncbi:hypothetical protein [Flagellimonas iocasae]|uniref:Uncharacterized protein n=1 Tax=Flagellimonas iocasae TaxID=2055905 RepID=A0ABW4XYT2_9FLAO
MDVFSILVIIASLFLVIKVSIANASIPVSRIEEYLVSKNLKYIRHQKVKKPWNPNFENGETLLSLFRYRKRYYLIDVEDHEGNPREVEATWYQSMSFLKNKAFFKIKH